MRNTPRLSGDAGSSAKKSRFTLYTIDTDSFRYQRPDESDHSPGVFVYTLVAKKEKNIMAVLIKCSVGKTIGLPGYSSYRFDLSADAEVSNLEDVPAEASRAYEMLMSCVDKEMSNNSGWLPGDEDRPQPKPSFQRGGTQGPPSGQSPASSSPEWNCSQKQQALIQKLMDEHNIPFAELDELAHQRFRCGLKQLNKMSASGLIDELFSTYRSKAKGGRR